MFILTPCLLGHDNWKLVAILDFYFNARPSPATRESSVTLRSNQTISEAFVLRTYIYVLGRCVTALGTYIHVLYLSLVGKGLKFPYRKIFYFPISDPIFHAMNFGEKIFRFG